MVLTSAMRIRGHRCFDHIHKNGIRYHSSYMVLRVAQAKSELMKSHKRPYRTNSCRCAVAISSKVSKKSVIRNRFRRTLHEHLKARLSESPKSKEKWALISLKPTCSLEKTNEMLAECDRLLSSAGLFS